LGAEFKPVHTATASKSSVRMVVLVMVLGRAVLFSLPSNEATAAAVVLVVVVAVLASSPVVAVMASQPVVAVLESSPVVAVLAATPVVAVLAATPVVAVLASSPVVAGSLLESLECPVAVAVAVVVVVVVEYVTCHTGAQPLATAMAMTGRTESTVLRSRSWHLVLFLPPPLPLPPPS
jgi:hypothetical protein